MDRTYRATIEGHTRAMTCTGVEGFTRTCWRRHRRMRTWGGGAWRTTRRKVHVGTMRHRCSDLLKGGPNTSTIFREMVWEVKGLMDVIGLKGLKGWPRATPCSVKAPQSLMIPAVSPFCLVVRGSGRGVTEVMVVPRILIASPCPFTRGEMMRAWGVARVGRGGGTPSTPPLCNVAELRTTLLFLRGALPVEMPHHVARLFPTMLAEGTKVAGPLQPPYIMTQPHRYRSRPQGVRAERSLSGCGPRRGFICPVSASGAGHFTSLRLGAALRLRLNRGKTLLQPLSVMTMAINRTCGRASTEFEGWTSLGWPGCPGTRAEAATSGLKLHLPPGKFVGALDRLGAVAHMRRGRGGRR